MVLELPMVILMYGRKGRVTGRPSAKKEQQYLSLSPHLFSGGIPCRTGTILVWLMMASSPLSEVSDRWGCSVYTSSSTLTWPILMPRSALKCRAWPPSAMGCIKSLRGSLQEPTSVIDVWDSVALANMPLTLSVTADKLVRLAVFLAPFPSVSWPLWGSVRCECTEISRNQLMSMTLLSCNTNGSKLSPSTSPCAQVASVHRSNSSSLSVRRWEGDSVSGHVIAWGETRASGGVWPSRRMSLHVTCTFCCGNGCFKANLSSFTVTVCVMASRSSLSISATRERSSA
mmetsp:Transcript_154897/g.496339  ORF Transcript_154897/g.496339 Transcript_154897/m.496339 type:complete len:286 (+) Transcript_154897:6252-7109(+)